MAIGIGDTLRSARRQQGRALSEAAADTRVRETYLAALEEEDFEALGGDVYVKGFLRSYARFLQLDPEPLLQAYREHYERTAPEPGTVARGPVAPLPREHQAGFGIVAAIGAILLVIVAAVGFLRGGGDPDDGIEIAPRPATETPRSDDSTPTPNPTLPAESEGVEVVVTVTGDQSWFRIVVDGENQLEGVRARTFSQTFSGEEEILVWVGNAGAVSMTVNGVDLGMLGDGAQIVRLRCVAGAVACEPVSA